MLRASSFAPMVMPLTRRTSTLVTRALVGIALLLAWTAVVRLGISGGSRHTTWTAQRFGTWPSTLETLAGSANVALSIHATYRSGQTVGWTTVGTAVDYGDPQNINGSRFVTGSSAGRVTSASVHVAGPVDRSPHDQFELAIYADDRGAPGRLLGHSAPATLTADAWNAVPIDVTLAPLTPYWLMYNTNGSSDRVNNVTLTPLIANPLDTVIHAPRAPWLNRVAWLFRLLGHPVATAAGLLMTAWWAGAWRRRYLVVLGAGLAGATALEFFLKHAVFAPFGAYPSGHVLRAAFLATVVLASDRRWPPRVLVLLLAVLSSLGTIRTNSHYAEEALGGALAGWVLATASLAAWSLLLEREAHPIDAAVNRRATTDRRHHDRRRRTASAT